MKNKNIFWIILLVIVVCVAGIILLGPEPRKDGVNKTIELGGGSTNNSKMQLKSIDEKTALYKANIVYPYFDNADQSFNDLIANTAKQTWDEFKQMTTENWKALKDTEFANQKTGDNPEQPFEFDLSCDIVQQTDKYISFVMRFGGYPGGGAHGYQNLITFTYDVANKKVIKLGDLFPTNPDYLKTLSEYSRKQLTNKLSQDSQDKEYLNNIKSMIEMGTEPTDDNFKNFTISKDNILTIYFGQYQVAPYASGEQRIEMSL
jgi:hypothetical protein